MYGGCAKELMDESFTTTYYFERKYQHYIQIIIQTWQCQSCNPVNFQNSTLYIIISLVIPFKKSYSDIDMLDWFLIWLRLDILCKNHFIGKVADDTLDEILDSYNPRLRLSHQSLSPPESISILRSILIKNISNRIWRNIKYL